MNCEKCGNNEFYIKSVDITYDIDFRNLSREKIEENLENGDYVNFNWSKGYIQVICSNCKNIIID